MDSEYETQVAMMEWIKNKSESDDPDIPQFLLQVTSPILDDLEYANKILTEFSKGCCTAIIIRPNMKIVNLGMKRMWANRFNQAFPVW